MNLFLAEDEPRLLYSTAYSIPWEEYGIDVVGTATNGIDALAMIERLQPDILLLDIQMPGLDGLSVARKAMSRGTRMKVIVLSGHDDFAYAKGALELGAVRYLLKPAGEDEIVEAVRETAERIRKEREAEVDFLSLRHRWEEHLPLLRAMFFSRWIHGDYTEEEIDRQAGRLVLDLPSDRLYALTVFELDPADEPSAEDASFESFALQTIAEDFFGTKGILVFQDAEQRVAALYIGKEDEIADEFAFRANDGASKLLALTEDALKRTASAGVSSLGGRGDAPTLYRQAIRALLERAWLGNNLVIPFTERTEDGLPAPATPEFERELETALGMGAADRAAELIAERFDPRGGELRSLEYFQEQALYLYSLLIRTIHKNGWSVRETAGDEFMDFMQPEALKNPVLAMHWLQRAARRIVHYGGLQRSTMMHRLISRLLAMIEEDLSLDITLHSAAEKLYLAPAYLSRLFKKETGVAFSAYLTDRKMTKARDLLMDGAKVYEAAAAVGYRDVSHFTKMFRRFWGTTPGELGRAGKGVS
ncbi:response regulator [Paenibacillus antri]|uniref:Response regulator n=1 Tax=Paenibacillus antri TaxID=2582848 RepID=A0A5R9GDL1_9BACL|nr:response regulator [Paenibacillus antri]TLS52426.1 response regulator [Paenibacillus antri]